MAKKATPKSQPPAANTTQETPASENRTAPEGIASGPLGTTVETPTQESRIATLELQVQTLLRYISHRASMADIEAVMQT